MTLTRPQFDLACKAYLSKHSRLPTVSAETKDDLLKRFPTGWTWKEHSLVYGLGYLSRTVAISSKSRASLLPLADDFEILEVEDDATAGASDDLTTCQQYVVFSQTFQVPAFYFSLHASNGTPLSLEDITASRLFLTSALPGSHNSTFALEAPGTAFAMLSQGDHPTLGTPCWYMHPCHTAEVVDEIMREIKCSEEDRPLRWLEAWFMVLGNVVDFRVDQ